MTKKGKKMDGYTAEKISEEEQAERLETAAELEPDTEVSVPTGEESHPVSSPDQREAMKALYKKGRRDRELTQREDADATSDVDMMQRMVAEASGGTTDAAEQLDTNRDMDQEERLELARRMQEEAAGEPDEETPEAENVNQEAEEAPDSLPPVDPDARVHVKILGKNMMFLSRILMMLVDWNFTRRLVLLM